VRSVRHGRASSCITGSPLLGTSCPARLMPLNLEREPRRERGLAQGRDGRVARNRERRRPSRLQRGLRGRFIQRGTPCIHRGPLRVRRQRPRWHCFVSRCALPALRRPSRGPKQRSSRREQHTAHGVPLHGVPRSLMARPPKASASIVSEALPSVASPSFARTANGCRNDETREGELRR
jgi:hypothetical protein